MKLTIKQKRSISYNLMQHGIKGETLNWEGLDISAASAVIGYLNNDNLEGAMVVLEDHGFTFTNKDKLTIE